MQAPDEKKKKIMVHLISAVSSSYWHSGSRSATKTLKTLKECIQFHSSYAQHTFLL